MHSTDSLGFPGLTQPLISSAVKIVKLVSMKKETTSEKISHRGFSVHQADLYAARKTRDTIFSHLPPNYNHPRRGESRALAFTAPLPSVWPWAPAVLYIRLMIELLPAQCQIHYTTLPLGY